MSHQLENAYQWTKIGIKEYNTRRYEECLYACEQAIQFDPNYARAYHGKGLALARLKRYEEALRTYQDASLIAPEDAKLHANLAGLLFYKGEYEKAELSYKRAIQLDSQFEAIYSEKAMLLLDKALKLLNSNLPTLDRFNSSIKVLRQLLLFNPSDSTALIEIGKMQKERGLTLVQYGRDWQAIDALLEASQLSPEDATVHANLAELFFCEGEYEKASLLYKKAIRLDKQFETAYAEKSKVLFDEAFNWLTPQHPSLSTRTAAISAFHKILLFNPYDPTILAEISKIQREVEFVKSSFKSYKGKLIYTDKRTNSASINVHSEQPAEEVRILFPEEIQDNKYFSRTADEWRVSFVFSSPETYFKIEVLRNGVVIAYGSYWIKYGYLVRRDTEYNIHLTFIYEPATTVYKPAAMYGEEQRKDKRSSSIIYVGRGRRVRRGS